MSLLSKCEFIITDDLCSGKQDDLYHFKFSYLGHGVFLVKAKGFLDEYSFKDQLQCGNLARERLTRFNSSLDYHLLWDMTEVYGISLQARRFIFVRSKQIKDIKSVGIIGANLIASTLGKMAQILISNIRFHFYRTYDEAIQKTEEHLKMRKNALKENASVATHYYSRFVHLWQKNPDFITANGFTYKSVSLPQWQYQSSDGNFKVHICVVEGSIVYSTCYGKATATDIEMGYQKLDEIIEEFGFNEENRLYSLLDLYRLTSLSLNARKILLNMERRIRPISNGAAFIPSPMLRLLYKILRRITSGSFAKWYMCDTVDDAFSLLMKHREGYNIKRDEVNNLDIQILRPDIPSDKAGMIKLIDQLYDENTQIKKKQQDNIQNITEIMSRITWDETFDPSTLLSNTTGGFSEMYYSLSMLYNDFQEIIGERMLHMQKLFESEDKYRNLINLANDIILVYQNNQIKFINSRVYQILGLNVDDVLGKSMDSYVLPEEAMRLKDYYNRRIKGEDLPWIYEVSFIHKDGHKVPVSMSVGKIFYENSPAILVIARDISERKKNEEELEQYRNHLEEIVKHRTLQLQKEINERKVAQESDRLKSAFLSNMSHEIRTPMNAIISFTEYLKDPTINLQQRNEYIRYIQSSGESLLNLINDIIDISKIEAQQLRIHNSNFMVNSLLSELQKYYDSIRKEHKKDIEIRLVIPQPKQNVALYSDKNRLKQILSNLLDNALKFTDCGFIEFGYRFEQDLIIFHVKDTGIGIPDDKKSLIFKRFGKIEAAGRNQSGTGLGLAISQQLAKLLNGSITVKSKVGEGTYFEVKLPYISHNDQPGVLPISTEKAALSEYNWQNITILIAEDEELNYRVLEIALKKTGVTLLRAKNGQEAVNLILAPPKNIDIILMDIQMPIMDGYEAVKIIKKHRPEIPVIAQTAFALLDEQKRCLSLGFDDYVSKPIRTPELFAKINFLLNQVY
jgi:PAS domain S-box-containing protein